MADKPWKAAERLVAGVLGGERVPITGRQRGDVPDVAHDWLSIEVKRRKLPDWIIDGHLQAIAASDGKKLPIVVIKQPRKHTMKSFVVMQMSDFVDYFGKVPQETVNHNFDDETQQ